ncbi:hypothetical protein GOP47_0000335, partial [Adiantum capillus-veneris]
TKFFNSYQLTSRRIIFYDSLGLTQSQGCLRAIYSWLELLAAYCLEPRLVQDLARPKEIFHIMEINGPQQPNAMDCGFYVMVFMGFFIEGAFAQKNSDEWLSPRMFSHMAVMMLCQRLHSWVQEISCLPAAN